MKVDFDPNDKTLYNDPEYWEFVNNFYRNSQKRGLEEDPAIIKLNEQGKRIRRQAIRELRRIKRERSLKWKLLKTLRKVYYMFISLKHFLYSTIKFE